MEIGICCSIGEANEVAQWFDYTEQFSPTFLMPDKGESEFQVSLDALKDSLLPAKVGRRFLTEAVTSVGPDVDMDILLAWTETSLRRAQQAGIETMVYGSGGTRIIPDGFPRVEATRQYISILKEMGPIAEKYGVTLGVEAVNRGLSNFVNSVTEAGEIVKAAAHPNVGLLVDFYHMALEDEGPESIVQYGDVVAHLHLAEPLGRRAPGTSGFDFIPYLAAVRRIGYDHRISLECDWRDLKSEAKFSVRYLKEQMRQAGFEFDHLHL